MIRFTSLQRPSLRSDLEMVDDVTVRGRHISGLNTRMLLGLVSSRLGEAGVAALLSGADETRDVALLGDDTSWSSYGQFRRLLEVAGRLLVDAGGLEAIGEAEELGRTSSPEIAHVLVQFGSPIAATMAMRDLPNSIYPIMNIEPEVGGPAHLVWRRRLAEGFEPFPELCTFVTALMPQLVRLFGLRVLAAEEVACQCRGDAECISEVRWDETEDLTVQLNLMRTRMEIAESRLAAFQDNVKDIVSDDALDTVLGRIVRSAARSMHAPGFILAVESVTDGVQLYTDGVTVDEAERLLADDPGYVSVDVESRHRRYGRLVAVAPPASVGHEQAALHSYARLAATALDSAFALEQARREAQTAQALLQLSTSLAALTSVEELASRLADAIPDVVDCDCSAVLLISDGVARVAAHRGYPADVVDELAKLQIPMGTMSDYHFQSRTLEEMSSLGRELMQASGLQAIATAPLTVDGATVGILVGSVRRDAERIVADSSLKQRFAGLAGQATVALRNSRLLEQIRHQSLHDPLTGLPNRALILDRTEQMLSRGRRNHTAPCALFIDLDGFKEINDTLGHDVGDQLLQQLAGRLTGTLRAEDTAGRLGGDEFVVLVECGSADAGIEAIAERILAVLREPVRIPRLERPLAISASIGIALGDRSSAADLLRDADIAVYDAKAAGKGCYRIFAPEMALAMAARAELGQRLFLADQCSSSQLDAGPQSPEPDPPQVPGPRRS
jgi:diguanylate cyclase (GGDEF)-like protein